MAANNKQNKTEATPAPQPGRAIYGFVMLSFALISYIIYILVSVLPTQLLTQFGWDYLPDKYWSIAIPAYIVLIVLMVVPVYMSLNIGRVNEAGSIANLVDEYTLDAKKEINPKHTNSSIDPIYDLPIGEVCQYLYLNKD